MVCFKYIIKQKEELCVSQTDRQFSGFLRMLISRLKKAIAAEDVDTMRQLLQELLTDLQNTLED